MPPLPPNNSTPFLKRSLFGVSFLDRIFFVQNLAIMLKAGLPLIDGLRSLALQMQHKNVQTMVIDVTRRIEAGASFEEGLKANPALLPPLAVTLIGAGERSGNLDVVFQRLSQQFKRDHEIRGRVKSALAYPTIVLVLMIGIAGFVFMFILPKLGELFKEFNTDLPLPTRILIALGEAAQNYGVWIIGAVLMIIAAIGLLARTSRGKIIRSQLALLLPIVRTIVRDMNIAAIARTLALLLRTDLPLLESLRLTANTLHNLNYRNALLAARVTVQEGKTLAEALAPARNILPPTVIEMIAVGEKSGSLDEVLDEVAEFYEQEVKVMFENLPTLIEPILIIVLGFGVGGLAVAVMLPIFKLSQQI